MLPGRAPSARPMPGRRRHARANHIGRARQPQVAALARADSPSPSPSSPWSSAGGIGPAAAAASAPNAPPPPPPLLLLQTRNKQCLTAAIEAGRLAAAIFTQDTLELARAWRGLARFEALLLLEEEEEEVDGGEGAGRLVPLPPDGGAAAPAAPIVGRWQRVPDAQALRRAEESLSRVDPGLQYVVMDALGGGGGGGGGAGDSWQIIPGENLVAFSQQQPWWRRSATRLLATASTAAGAAAALGSLEAGTDGVVLVTDAPGEVRATCAALEQHERARSPPLLMSSSRSPSPPSPAANKGSVHPVYEEAVVTRVEPVGMADRACVDLASALRPGEGLLVGCFARALFLVHSERDESAYIAARPFRVNAGPLAQYVLAEGPSSSSAGRTAYLSELRCGATVAVAGADGRLADARAVVARVKVERRPVVLVEAETSGDGGGRHSVLLQNAETVKLVGPSGDAGDSSGWRAVSVAQLAQGDRVYVLRQPAARHTGLAVEEGVSER